MNAVLPLPPRGLSVPDSPVTAEWIEARSRAPWPELRAAEAEVESKRAALALARRARWPETGFAVGYNRMWPEPEMRATVGMSLNVPLHLARLSDAEHEARAALAAAEARRDAARDRVERDLEIAAAGFAESRHEVDVMQLDVVPASERLMAARRSAYESGRGDFLALIGAVRTLHRARLDADEAVAAALRAHAELRRALALDAAPTPGGER
jgi:outer membrane protein TolC